MLLWTERRSLWASQHSLGDFVDLQSTPYAAVTQPTTRIGLIKPSMAVTSGSLSRRTTDGSAPSADIGSNGRTVQDLPYLRRALTQPPLPRSRARGRSWSLRKERAHRRYGYMQWQLAKAANKRADQAEARALAARRRLTEFYRTGPVCR